MFLSLPSFQSVFTLNLAVIRVWIVICWNWLGLSQPYEINVNNIYESVKNDYVLVINPSTETNSHDRNGLEKLIGIQMPLIKAHKHPVQVELSILGSINWHIFLIFFKSK